MRCTAIALTVLAAWLTAAPVGDAAPPPYFGIAQGQFNAKGQLGDRDLDAMVAQGVRTVRIQLAWKAIERTRGSFDWGPSDRFVGALASRGVQALPFVWGSPRWVASDPGRPPVDAAAHEQAWRAFLAAAVARYGADGAYWGAPYHQQYGADATPMPLHFWQIWNEPNLRKYFNPEGTDSAGVWQYGRLLRISSQAIKNQDPDAKIVLAGNPGYPPRGGLKAWEFLNRLYRVPGIKSAFDIAALHPYANNLWAFGAEIRNVRAVMRNHGDLATPLWLTEFGWGSAPPDRFGINQGIAGQQRLLRGAFHLVLTHRSEWDVQRMYWFLWRDPAPDSRFAHRCSFCGSAGLLRYDRTPKPAYWEYTRYSADRTPPRGRIISGPRAHTNDPTPSLSFASSEPGSTFICRLDSAPFTVCRTPRILGPLSDGRHKFVVRPIDAPGNVGGPVERVFTIDTHRPPRPRITGTDPASPANDNNPRVRGTAVPGPWVRLFRGAGCGGPPVASGSAAEFASPGLAVSVGDNTTTTFHANSRDAAGNVSRCSTGFTYVERTPAR